MLAAHVRGHHDQVSTTETAGGRHERGENSITVADLVDRHGHDEPTTGASPVRSEPAAQPGPSAGQDGPEPHKWWTLVAVCLGTFMLLLDVTIVNVALPDIQSALGSSFSDLQWVVDAYALTLASLLLTTGSLADLFGRRKLYLIGLVVFSVASLLCGLAQDTLLLQLSRALQGIGGAVMFAVSLALLADAFRGKDRGVAFGIWGAITGLAVALGPLLGGVLTAGLSWRWIFFVNLPIGVIAFVLTVARVSESRSPAARRPDWVGFVVFTASLAALVYGLIESAQKSFTDPLVLSCLIGSGVLMLAFLVIEAKGKQPMFDLALFRKPTFVGGSVAAFSLSASIFAMLLYFVLYLQDVLGFDALGVGLRLLVISGGTLVAATVAGRISSHVPVRALIGTGLVLVGVGLLLMRGLTADSTWTHLVVGLAVSGVGIGLVNPPLASTAIGVVRPQQAGMASGINSTFRQIGIATGIALLGTLFSSRVGSEIASRARGVAALRGHTGQLASAVQNGGTAKLLAHLPAGQRPQVEKVAAGAFAAGLNHIFLIAAILALAAGVIAFATIRGRDFAQQD